MHYDIDRTIDATVEPVTLAQAKQHARVEIDDDDDLISLYITAARQFCEKVTGRAFIQQTWRLSLETFPFLGMRNRGIAYDGFGFYMGAQSRLWRPAILLPRPKLIGIGSVTYLDQTGTRQTLDPSAYYVDLDAEPAQILPVANTIWPFALWQRGSVQITYTAGYGVDATNVPATLQIAILQLIAHWYENRESTILPTSGTGLVAIPQGVADLLDSETFTAFTLES